MWRERIEVASGEAQRGPWRMNDSDFRWVDDPAVDVNRHGEFAVVWADQATKDLAFQRFDREGRRALTPPTNVSNSPDTFSWLPRIVTARADPRRVFILWQEIVFSGGSHGGEIFFASSSNSGRSFAKPVNLSNSVAGDGKGRLDRDTWDNGSLDLSEGPHGELYAAWTEYEGALWFRRALEPTASFEEATRIAGTNDAPARGPSLAVAKEGAVHLAWAVGESPSADIYVTHSRDRGRSFSTSHATIASAAHSDAPKIAVDPRGVVHVVYAEENQPGAGAYHIRHALRRPTENEFSPSRPIEASRSERESAHRPHLAIDSRGHLYVAWEVARVGDPRPQQFAFAYSRDGGARFSRAYRLAGISAPALGVNGSQQGLLTSKLATNEAGTLAIVNSTFRAGVKSHIWLLTGSVGAGSSSPD